MNPTIPDLSLFTVLLHLALSIGLCYACFCRLTKTDENTPLRVRATLFVTADVALLLVGAPFFWGMVPSAWSNLLLAASLASKIVSSELWKYGVPEGYDSEATPSSGNVISIGSSRPDTAKNTSAKDSPGESLGNAKPLAKTLNDKISS